GADRVRGQCEGGLSRESRGASPHAGMLLSSRALRLSAALNFVLLLGVGYGVLKVAPNRKREMAEVRPPQFVQPLTILGPSRDDGTSPEIPSTRQRIVFSFYLTRPFRH